LERDPHVADFGQIPGDGCVEVELAVVHQNHGGDAGHRLGHRGDPENGIRLHRDSLGAVLESDGLQIGELAALCDCDDGARYKAV
jgi:hypothetical protein